MPEFLYPGHNYLGPGNVLDHGEPVDNADEIAREHDFAYSVARREEDIYRADWQAIKQFGGDFVSTGNVADVVGIVGLGAKTIVERPLGTVLYGMPKGKDRGFDVPWGYNRRGEPFYNRGMKVWKDRHKKRSVSAG